MRDANDLGTVCAAKGIVPLRLTMNAEAYEAAFLASGTGYGMREIIARLTGRSANAVTLYLAAHPERTPLFDEILGKGAWIEVLVQAKPRKAWVSCLTRAETKTEVEALIRRHLGVAARVV